MFITPNAFSNYIIEEKERQSENRNQQRATRDYFCFNCSVPHILIMKMDKEEYVMLLEDTLKLFNVPIDEYI